MVYHNRYECKFVVSESVAARVLRRVAPYVQPDPHAARRPGNTYPIASLYLDDEINTLCRETREGRMDRVKLRVRTYGDGPLFLEIKRRRNGIVQKMRCPAPADALPSILSGQATTLPGLSPQKERSLQEFVRLVAVYRAVPRLTVRYDREAYVGLDDDQHRVTFDRRLSSMAEPNPRVRVHDQAYVTVPMGGVVLELKFTDRCPPWMLDATRALQLSRRSFSKYATCVEALLTVERADQA